jgi:putative transposase
MARLARLCIAGQLHVIMQKARNEERVLADESECTAYWSCLRRAAEVEKVAIHAFALTPSQVRILATPPSHAALGAMMQSAGRQFVAGYNRRHGRNGPLWSGRFQATVVDPDRHFIDCLRFVESAPVQMGLVEQAQRWPWSSAAHHCGQGVAPGISEHRGFWALGNTPFEREAQYKRVLEIPMDAAKSEAIAKATQQGWAIGPSAFVAEMAQLVKTRRIQPAKRGRPVASRSK